MNPFLFDTFCFNTVFWYSSMSMGETAVHSFSMLYSIPLHVVFQCYIVIHSIPYICVCKVQVFCSFGGDHLFSYKFITFIYISWIYVLHQLYVLKKTYSPNSGLLLYPRSGVFWFIEVLIIKTNLSVFSFILCFVVGPT